MIIDASYFVLQPLAIPQAQQDVPSMFNRDYSGKSGINAFIDRYEAQFLLNVLGRDQYVELLDQFESDGTWKPTALQKWKDLVDGVDDWNGLRYTIGDYKVSVIAYYVFYYYLRDTESYFATTGMQRPEAANSTSISANVNLVTQWNKFVTMYSGDKCFSNYWDDIWFDWAFAYPSEPVNSQSLFAYMNSNTDLYNTDHFVLYQYKNRHGL